MSDSLYSRIEGLRAQRARLLEMRANGISSTTDQNGERVVFKSDAEMKSALAALDRELAALASGPITSIRFNTSKGL
ncbi:phage head-tail joining protein [Roseomonas mucosa]